MLTRTTHYAGQSCAWDRAAQVMSWRRVLCSAVYTKDSQSFARQDCQRAQAGAAPTWTPLSRWLNAARLPGVCL